jgi:hypothetical protein
MHGQFSGARSEIEAALQGFDERLTVEFRATVGLSQATSCEQLEHIGVDGMFDALYPSLQSLFVVSRAQRQHATQNEGTPVELRGHEVHRGTVLRIARLDCASMGVQALVCR